MSNSPRLQTEQKRLFDTQPDARRDLQAQLHDATGRWSAFVVTDLAAVFGDDAQAEVLARIQPISAADWQRATTPTAHDDPRPFFAQRHERRHGGHGLSG